MRYEHAAAFRMALDRRIINDARGNPLRIEWYRKRITFDRILARLEIVAPGEFVLKGGLALHYRFGNHARSTYDMDFAVQDISRMREVMQQLAEIELGDFFSVSVTKEPEKAFIVDQGITAYRWSLETRLDNKTFERSVIDIGVGDVISHEHVSRIKTQPILTFADIEPTEIHVISLERHIAEKIHAYVQDRGGRENTRIKDLIDLCLLSHLNLEISSDAAYQALVLTFNARETSIPADFPLPPESWHSRYLGAAWGVDVPATLEQAWDEARTLVMPILEHISTT
jgi:predicted nucleotidyltransferase component of viral defense system